MPRPFCCAFRSWVPASAADCRGPWVTSVVSLGRYQLCRDGHISTSSKLSASVPTKKLESMLIPIVPAASKSSGQPRGNRSAISRLRPMRTVTALTQSVFTGLSIRNQTGSSQNAGFSVTTSSSLTAEVDQSRLDPSCAIWCRKHQSRLIRDHIATRRCSAFAGSRHTQPSFGSKVRPRINHRFILDRRTHVRGTARFRGWARPLVATRSSITRQRLDRLRSRTRRLATAGQLHQRCCESASRGRTAPVRRSSSTPSRSSHAGVRQRQP